MTNRPVGRSSDDARDIEVRADSLPRHRAHRHDTPTMPATTAWRMYTHHYVMAARYLRAYLRGGTR